MIAATLGWIGAAGTLLAYLSLSRGWLSSTSRRYVALNITGGALAGLACTLYGAWPSAASNFVWAAVGLLSVTTTRRDRVERAPLPVEACASA